MDGRPCEKEKTIKKKRKRQGKRGRCHSSPLFRREAMVVVGGGVNQNLVQSGEGLEAPREKEGCGER